MTHFAAVENLCGPGCCCDVGLRAKDQMLVLALQQQQHARWDPTLKAQFHLSYYLSRFRTLRDSEYFHQPQKASGLCFLG